MQSWLEGRIWVGKGAQATGMTTSLRIQSSKADSNTWESFTRSGLKLESVHQESPRSDVFRKRATKPLLNQRQHQKHLTWAVEKKNWGLIYKMLRRNHPKFDLTIISKICLRAIHRMNVRTENARTRESWTCAQLTGFSSLPCKRLLINIINI